MSLNLREIPAYVIHSRRRPDRKYHIERELEKAQIRAELIPAIECEPGIIGAGLSHLGVLRNARSVPFLVLEDDCALTEHYWPELDIPLIADAVYLGHSSWGMTSASSCAINHAVEWTRFSKDWLQVHNMLSAHAILYTSVQFVQAAQEAIVKRLTMDSPFDIGLALLQRRFRVLSPNLPMFYQAKEVGGQEEATCRALGESVIA